MIEVEMSGQAAALRELLASQGVMPALDWLNERTNYRYTGIYKYDGDVMRAVHVFDRHAEHRTWLRAVPLNRSFCRYVLQHGEFLTTSASQDPRLGGHPYEGLVESYYGRLLRREDGAPYGTFIHFDMEPRVIAPRELGFLQEAVPLLLPYLD